MSAASASSLSRRRAASATAAPWAASAAAVAAPMPLDAPVTSATVPSSTGSTRIHRPYLRSLVRSLTRICPVLRPAGIRGRRGGGGRRGHGPGDLVEGADARVLPAGAPDQP